MTYFINAEKDYKYTREDILNWYEPLQQENPERYNKIKEKVKNMEASDFKALDNYIWKLFKENEYYLKFLAYAFEQKFKV